MSTHPDIDRAMLAMRQHQFAQAGTLLLDLLDKQPANVPARWLLIQSLEARQELAEVQEQLRMLLIHVRKDLAAIDAIAAHVRERGYPLDHVIQAYRKHLKANPQSANAAFNCAYNLTRVARFEEAISEYERALQIGISGPEEVHLNIANIWMDHLHDQERATAHLETALQLNPRYSSAHYNLGNISERQGDRDAARLNFKRCLELDPDNQSALARLADTQHFTSSDDPLLSRLEAAAMRNDNSDVQMAIGKAYEQLGRFDEAWAHFRTGNKLDAAQAPAYREGTNERFSDLIATTCTGEWLNQFAGQSHQPLFICGKFRSGSTLLEQMLAAHPKFVAGGESEFFSAAGRPGVSRIPERPGKSAGGGGPDLVRTTPVQVEKLFGEAGIVTDKRPDNVRYLGLIKAILPSARIIITERDWRDVATSVFSVRLGPGQTYATNLKFIRHAMQQQERLVDHWSRCWAIA